MAEDIELVRGNLYRLRSRNLPYGVYDGKGGFVGIREKFGDLYLFTEYAGSTAFALEDLGHAPVELEGGRDLYDYLADAELTHGRGEGYGGRPGDPVREES